MPKLCNTIIKDIFFLQRRLVKRSTIIKDSEQNSELVGSVAPTLNIQAEINFKTVNKCTERNSLILFPVLTTSTPFIPDSFDLFSFFAAIQNSLIFSTLACCVETALIVQLIRAGRCFLRTKEIYLKRTIFASNK